jgi:hypothetical protein
MNWNRFAIMLTAINFVFLIALLIQSRMIANQTIPDVLRVHAFELVDDKGQVRAQFNVEEPSGEVVFRLRDAGGIIRVKMSASEMGSGFLLINNRTEPGVHILAREDNTGLTLTDQNGAKQVIEP